MAAAFAASDAAAQAPIGQQIAEAELRVQEALDDLAELRRSIQEESEAAEETPQTESVAELRADTTDPIERIREEGLERSQVMEIIGYLTDVIGPRLTGSPNLQHANEWTRDTLESWGLVNARLEPWGPFGRGWSIESFSVQVVEPYAIPLTAIPNAWTPGLEEPITRPALRLEVPTRADLEKYIGELEGKIVLMGRPSDVEAHFEPQAARRTDSQLQELANATGRGGGFGRGGGGRGGRGGPGGRGGFGRGGGEQVDPLTQPVPLTEGVAFAFQEGAAAVLITSTQGDGGTIFAQSAVPPFAGRGGGGARAWDLEPPEISPQVTLAREDYNRLVRMLEQGTELEIALDLRVQFHEDDLMGYNTVAEIPGSDLSHEVVMLGGHLDSWHVGTGATDNAAGVAAAMEAVRIIQALELQPRRTIRVGLWTGEEQGLIGSEQYVTQNFGYFTSAATAAGRGGAGRGGRGGRGRAVVRLDDYDNFSAYFNLDNGTGRIRGVYMQGNEDVRPIFQEWLAPFSDLGAETLTINGVGGTDHTNFDAVGLPGFQFIQDPIEYSSRTHHSTADVYDRIQEEDIKQAATIMAAFAYQAAMMDEKLPRKPAPPLRDD